jgi:hypothetical protein
MLSGGLHSAQGMELIGRFVGQRLMRTLCIVPGDPARNYATRFLDGLKRVLPDAFLFDTPDKSFCQTVDRSVAEESSPRCWASGCSSR